MVLSENYFL